MHTLLKTEIPGVGKVELSWVQMPLPAVKLNAEGKVVKVEDTEMGEGDAMATTAKEAVGREVKEERRDLDYDVADDNDWDQIQ